MQYTRNFEDKIGDEINVTSSSIFCIGCRKVSKSLSGSQMKNSKNVPRLFTKTVTSKEISILTGIGWWDTTKINFGTLIF